MSYTPIPAIIRLLEKFQIAQARQRAHIASTVANTGKSLTEEKLSMLMRHFAACGGDCSSMVAAALADGSWAGLVQDLMAERAREGGDVQTKESIGGSTIAGVSADNTYGWDNHKALRAAFDHNKPGKWNAYRQCYNLTQKEREEACAKDYRRHGCSRWDVIGKERTNRINFDLAEVEIARLNPPTPDDNPAEF